MGFFKSIGKVFKNIGRGISKTFKSVAKATTKVLKKAWKSPIIRGIVIAAAMYFSAGTLAPALSGIGITSATAQAAITGAATLSVVNGVGAAVSGESVGKGMAKGAVMGAVSGAAAGYFGGASSAADGATQAGTDVAGNATVNAATNSADGMLVDVPWQNAAGQVTNTVANNAVDAAAQLSGGAGSSFFNGSGLLSKVGNGAADFIGNNKLEVAKMVLGGIQSANTPDKIDIQNNQAALDRQNMQYKIDANGVPIDSASVQMGGTLQPSGLLNITPAKRLQLQSNPALNINPAYNFNAQQYAG